jgi:hypothetical protein
MSSLKDKITLDRAEAKHLLDATKRALAVHYLFGAALRYPLHLLSYWESLRLRCGSLSSA